MGIWFFSSYEFVTQNNYKILYRTVHHHLSSHISKAYCKTVVTPLLTHWIYGSLALNHRSVPYNAMNQFIHSLTAKADKLTHLFLVPPICVSELSQHWFLSGAKPHLNQSCVIVNWTLRNKFQWIFVYQVQKFSCTKMHLKYHLQKWHPFLSRGDELSHR